MTHPKTIFLQVAIATLLALPAPAQTQSAITQDACAQTKQADQALNATYAKVLKDYAKDAQFLAKFKQAQRAWIAFRDAHLEAGFPKAGPNPRPNPK
jgi:uncharacterized protein YecT (DUF1311 family)